MSTSEKETPASHWNFRVATRLRTSHMGEWREFLYISGYYTNGVLNSYGITNIGDGYDELDSLKWTHSKLSEALQKEVIDLDNFPNIYISKD